MSFVYSLSAEFLVLFVAGRRRLEPLGGARQEKRRPHFEIEEITQFQKISDVEKISLHVVNRSLV